ncbi:MAG: ComF family protein [Rehaibacterium terrae]|uniref:ComF family protein n=1 Tax=Rehaibacterium terrae TaxID=1341696 RepID=UPI00391BA441
MTLRIARLGAHLGRWLLPPRCLICGESGTNGRDICAICAETLPWNRVACPCCALPLPAPAPACGRCLKKPPPFAATVAAFAYGFPVDRLLPRFKFHGDLAAGRALARGLLDMARHADRPQALIPVPLHPRRLRERGYNQALELARPVGRALGIALRGDALARVRETAAQTELGALARRRNVRRAFEVRAGTLPPHVALVDDVMTTGATLAECAAALRRAGVARVDVWVAARAPARR